MSPVAWRDPVGVWHHHPRGLLALLVALEPPLRLTLMRELS